MRSLLLNTPTTSGAVLRHHYASSPLSYRLVSRPYTRTRPASHPPSPSAPPTHRRRNTPPPQHHDGATPPKEPSPSSTARSQSPLVRFTARLRTLLSPQKPLTTDPDTPSLGSRGTSRPLARTLDRLPPFARILILSILTLMLYSPLILFFHQHIAQLMWITGPSMYPFLNTDYYGTGTGAVKDNGKVKAGGGVWRDVVWVSLWRPYEDLRRGEIVAFWSPRDPEKMLVKRVIGLEGDYVRHRDAGETVKAGNQQSPVAEKRMVVEGGFGELVSISDGPRGQSDWEQVPQGHVWVEGEHGAEGGRWTWDSNAYGPISTGLIVGKVKAVVYPFRKAGRIRWEDWRGDARVRDGDVQERIAAFYG